MAVPKLKGKLNAKSGEMFLLQIGEDKICRVTQCLAVKGQTLPTVYNFGNYHNVPFIEVNEFSFAKIKVGLINNIGSIVRQGRVLHVGYKKFHYSNEPIEAEPR